MAPAPPASRVVRRLLSFLRPGSGPFFRRYLKGEEKGWEAAPKVRVSLYRYGDKYPVYDQVETDYLLHGVKIRKTTEWPSILENISL
ncbi:hypothetical protein LTS06_012219 [Exophiala xenobiotica]|nr:hypothetical protein LTS06_012219 [Exophiala xenobiotica]